MCKINLKLTRMMVSKFVEHATSQSWGFSYTDKIGSCCEQIYSDVQDSEIRAEVIYCALEVGKSHNRWSVMSTFDSLMYAPKLPGEPAVIAKKLNEASSDLREWAAERLMQGRLDENISAVLWPPLF
jgi:hypothetical protein